MNGFLIVNGLSGLLIVTSLLVTLAGNPANSARFYALQSFILVMLFVALAGATGSGELYLWSFSAFVTKVVLVPTIMYRAFRKLSDPAIGSGAVMSTALSIVAAAAVVILCFGVASKVTLPAADAIKPALAVSLALFFVGLGCIVAQRNILKQVFGYCLMENGSHLTLALLAPNAPELVEIGIATDAIFAVVVMAALGSRIFGTLHTLDARQLTTLKG
ncbi:hydrogenase 4 membrane subunit [Azospirillum sp. TSO35-2]|uniref:hydrogenase 4 membrane subunit n=1 Tax=Azospirillum sp. TSO35-2 TaxID=716796 RepID=UPI000D619532|nr:hydrogenase 4 membrane subunit [Azospirillum sp. TSO35-2]PWC36083.1 hydrogenase 4 membrane subunit [Azospirillum sp. TSO35-2]